MKDVHESGPDGYVEDIEPSGEPGGEPHIEIHRGGGIEIAHLAIPSSPNQSGDCTTIHHPGLDTAFCAVHDTMGKGAQAFPMAAAIKEEIDRLIAAGVVKPLAVKRRLNAWALRRGTLVAGTVFLWNAGHIEIAAAGTDPPIVVSEGRGLPLVVSGPIHGLTRNPVYQTATRRLHHRELLLVYSDGLSELGVESKTGVMIDMAGFAELLDPDLSLGANMMRCLEEISLWPRHDDISLLLARPLPVEHRSVRAAVRIPRLPLVLEPAWGQAVSHPTR
jgi:serine phosphatase RsbU (regulator of sigma subunit)